MALRATKANHSDSVHYWVLYLSTVNNKYKYKSFCIY